eukprot:7037069-Alexandrium_andersonii.AAC.1
MESLRMLASLELYRVPQFPDETARGELYFSRETVCTNARAELRRGMESPPELSLIHISEPTRLALI